MGTIKIGDVFEIRTSNGKAFLQFAANDERIGQLIRVFCETPGDAEFNPDFVFAQKEKFVVFFALRAAVRKHIVEKVGNYWLDSDLYPPKYMRSKHRVRGESLGWHIVNTHTWEREFVKELSDEEKKLSPWGIWNDTLLVERLNEGWSLDSWA